MEEGSAITSEGDWIYYKTDKDGRLVIATPEYSNEADLENIDERIDALKKRIFTETHIPKMTSESLERMIKLQDEMLSSLQTSLEWNERNNII